MTAPTPWTLQPGDYRGRGGEAVRPVVDADGLLVADASSWYCSAEQMSDNAKLLAASPALRDAVQTLAAVSGTVTISNGVATLPDNSTLDLAAIFAALT